MRAESVERTLGFDKARCERYWIRPRPRSGGADRPRGARVCKAYGIVIPKEGVAKNGRRSRGASLEHRISGRHENRLAADSAPRPGGWRHRGR